MANGWRKAMTYLGLGPDDEYDDYDDVEPIERAPRPAPEQRSSRPPTRRPAEPDEPDVAAAGTVRPPRPARTSPRGGSSAPGAAGGPSRSILRPASASSPRARRRGPSGARP